MLKRINYRPLNIKVFEDTAERCRTNVRLRKSIAQSRQSQKFTGESEDVPCVHQSVFADRAKIVVSQKRTLEAAQAYVGSKVAVLNFASASNPGGGVMLYENEYINNLWGRQEAVLNEKVFALILNFQSV